MARSGSAYAQSTYLLASLAPGDIVLFPRATRRLPLWRRSAYTSGVGRRAFVKPSREFTCTRQPRLRTSTSTPTDGSDVHTPAGVLVPHRPSLPWQQADELHPHIGPDTLPTTTTGTTLDLHYA